MRRTEFPKRMAVLLLLLPSFAGMLLLLYATRWGIGVSPDSLAYLAAGHSFAQGHGAAIEDSQGIYHPLKGYGPLLPFVAGLMESAGWQPLAALKGLNCVLLGATVFLSGFLLWRNSVSIGYSVAAALLVASALPILTVHAYAWSEPLFLLAAVSVWLLLAGYLERPALSRLLVISLLAAGALLARYAGVSLIAAAAASILFLGSQPPMRRFRDSCIFGALSFCPMLARLWMTRQSGQPVYQPARLHPFSFEHLNSMLYTFSIWLVPESVSGELKRMVLATALGLLCLLVFRYVKLEGKKYALPASLALFVIAYLGMVILTISVFWPAWERHPVDSRILSPVFLAALISILWMTHFVLSPVPVSRVVRIGAMTLVLLLTASSMVQAVAWAKQSHEAGLGYTSRLWQESWVVQAVKDAPAVAEIFSNQPALLGFLARRDVKEITRTKMDLLGAQPGNPGTPKPEILVVFLYKDSDSAAIELEKELRRAAPVSLLTRSAEGAVYLIKE